MVVTQPLAIVLIGGLSVLVCVVAVIVALLSRGRRSSAHVAYAERAFALPAARRLLRRQRRSAIALLVVALVGATAAGVVVARPVEVSVTRAEQNNRDIVLCLDVSGSMRTVDRRIVDTFRVLAGNLTGERIALVAFDASPLAVFPLTSDYEFIRDQLSGMSAALGDEVRAGQATTFVLREGTRFGPATSAVGDGLRACTLQFDGDGSERTRTIVLASDNSPVGVPLVSLPDAVSGAVDAGITVMALSPKADTDPKIEALRAEVRRTGGQTFYFADGEGVRFITDFVRDRESTTTLGPAVITEEDRTGPVLALLGVLSVLLLLLARKVV